MQNLLRIVCAAHVPLQPLRLEQPLSVMGFGGTPTEYLSRYLL